MKKWLIFLISFGTIFIYLNGWADCEKIDIIRIQTRLIEVGFNPGPIDGILGKRTIQAVVNFQKANHLPATGLLNSETLKKLNVNTLKDDRTSCEEKKWSQQECKVWERIRFGKIANLKEIVENLNPQSLKNWCDPRKPGNYPAESLISSNFIHSLLSNSKYREAIPSNGVEIMCAKFEEFIDLSDISFDKPFKIKYSVFKKSLSLRNMQTTKDLNFQDSYFAKDVQADFLKADCNLNLQRIQLDSSAKLLLRDAKIGGQLNLKNAYIDGKIIAEKAEIGGDLLLFTPDETLSMDKRGRFNDLNLAFIKVGKFLQLRGSKFSGPVNLSGANIKGELHIASPGTPPPLWEKGSSIRLRNTYVYALQVMKDCWPDKIDIIGFVYDIPYGLRSQVSHQNPENTPLGEQEPDELIKWLRRQEGYGKSFYPQPYEQLSKVLRREGRINAANRIMYYSKLDETHSENTGFRRWLWLSITYIFIGFGYYPWRSCFYIVALILIGAVLLRRDISSRSLSFGEILSYSLDAALPLISLNEEIHKKLTMAIKPPLIYWYYFQKIAAFILFTFLVAGLSGLVK